MLRKTIGLKLGAPAAPVNRRALLLAPIVSVPLLAFERPAEAGGPASVTAPDLPFPFPGVAPDPPLVPRRNLSQPFAVLLLRSTYEAVDSLDFVAMDKKDFWLVRASEQPSYKLLFDPLPFPIGDVTNPIYFDFISAVQYFTVADELKSPARVFEEFCEVTDPPTNDCPSGKRVIARDPTLSDNSRLVGRIAERAGDSILTGLRFGFRGEQFGGPDPPGPLPAGASLTPEFREGVEQGVRRIAKIFQERGYAIQCDVQWGGTGDGPAQGDAIRFRLNSVAPANAWGLQALQARRLGLANSYLELTLEAYLRAAGLASSYDISAGGSSISSVWTARPARA